MSALAHKISTNNTSTLETNNTTSISVTARIEYILRFSKQTVLVIDENIDVYSQVAGQFLDSISHSTNAAFISASIKLNDIQMRCRIIEQLFGNTLFDPEQSLAVSILRLSENETENIVIVIENAQSLSLQLTYELCQLSLVAKKAKQAIGVVLLGLPQAGQQVAGNKALFNNKISIVAADSGQVMSMEHPLFKLERSLISAKAWRIILITGFSMLLLSLFTWLAISQHENLSFSGLMQKDDYKTSIDETASTEGLPSNTDIAIKSSTIHKNLAVKTVLTKASINESEKQSTLLFGERSSAMSATTHDVYQALIVSPKTNKTSVAKPNVVKPMIAAQPNDIIQALNTSLPAQQYTAPLAEVITSPLPLAITPNYYLSIDQGYVLQLVGFTDEAKLKQFILDYPGLSYFSYQRKLNNKRFIVLTTKVYSTKENAKEAKNKLSGGLAQLNPWIKSVTDIKKEITEFNRVR